MNLADIYSAVDSKKRALLDALRNPGASIDKAVGNLRDNSRQMSQEFDQSGYLPQPGQAPHPNQEQAREALGQRGTDMALAGMFMGPGSATWDATKAQRAVERLRKGDSPQFVWEDTGTMRGADQGLRQELNDQGAMLRKNLTGLAKPLKDVLDHPEFAQAYPGIMAYHKAQLIPGKNSAYSPKDRLITIGADQNGGEADWLSSMLHELQHSIQYPENWAKGTNPKIFEEGYRKRGLPESEVTQKAWQRYRDTAGEVEPRLTQARQYLSNVERRMLYPKLRGAPLPESQGMFGVDLTQRPLEEARQIAEQMRRTGFKVPPGPW